jgi:hypothetical protein
VSVAVTVPPPEPVPVAVTVFVNAWVTFASEHVYVIEAPGAIEPNPAMLPALWLQFGASGSLVLTFESVSWLGFETTIVQVAVPPLVTCCVFGFFDTEIDGAGGAPPGGDVTVTAAVSVACTFAPPSDGVPVAVALFVKPAVTFASEQL